MQPSLMVEFKPAAAVRQIKIWSEVYPVGPLFACDMFGGSHSSCFDPLRCTYFFHGEGSRTLFTTTLPTRWPAVYSARKFRSGRKRPPCISVRPA